MKGFLVGVRARWKTLSASARAAVAAGVVAASIAAATVEFGSGAPAAVQAEIQPTPPAPPTSSATSGTTKRPFASPVSLFTGLPGEAGKVFAVKIDNIVDARPQTGIDSASIVYAVPVEGGLSRFMAVYDSEHLPKGDRIGPVRSARESDLPILEQYGRIGFVYSGAMSKFLPVLAGADVVNQTPEKDGGAFFRSGERAAPHNQYVRPSSILRKLPDSAKPRDIGFRFGPAPVGGSPAASYTARMPAASFTFKWSPVKGKYLVAIDGKPARTTDGDQMGAPTIVVQKIPKATSPRGFTSSPGVLSPFAPTVGSGTAVVLRDGKAYNANWSRMAADRGTVFSYQGKRMMFHPGQVWVVLEPH